MYKVEEIKPELEFEGIKLTRRSNGYNWEIKLRAEKVDDKMLKRLAEINEKLYREYGD